MLGPHIRRVAGALPHQRDELPAVLSSLRALDAADEGRGTDAGGCGLDVGHRSPRFPLRLAARNTGGFEIASCRPDRQEYGIQESYRASDPLASRSWVRFGFRASER